MIIDKLLEIAYRLSLAVAVGTRTFGNVLDLQSIRNQGNLGDTEQPGFLITFTTAMVGAGSSVQFNLVADNAIGLPSPAVLAASPVIPVAEAIVGKQVFIPLPNTDLHERFLGVQQVTTGATITAGNVSIEFTSGRRTWRPYPSVSNG